MSVSRGDKMNHLELPTPARYGSLAGGRSRKLSAPPPIQQHHNSWSLEPPSPHNGIPRSLSRSGSPSRCVSDVTRRISTTMGWRSPGIGEVVTQAKCLCSQYIRARLKRAGLLHKKLGLQRIQSVANLEGGREVFEVFPRVLGIGLELERCHPKLYSSIARQLSLSLTSDKVVRAIMITVASDVFKEGVTWAQIISLLAVAAGLASDCVKQGHPEYVRALIDAIGLVTERHTASWISDQGGWSALLTWSQAPEVEGSTLKILVLSVMGLILTCFVLTMALKTVGQYVT